MSEIMTVSMDSETLSGLKGDIDNMINRTLRTMHSSQNGEAVISVKLKISLEKRAVDNEKVYREAVCPKFEHDIQSVVQTKDKISGATQGDYELVYDPKLDRWVMRDMRAQVSMFDADAQPGYSPEHDEPVCLEEGTPALEAPDMIEADDDFEPDPEADCEEDEDIPFTGDNEPEEETDEEADEE